MQNSQHIMIPSIDTHSCGTQTFRDGFGCGHPHAHDAILSDTLGICACGDHDAAIDLVLRTVSAALVHGTSLPSLVALEIARQPEVTAALILHWFDEMGLLSHEDDLSSARLTSAGRSAVISGALPRNTAPSPEAAEDILFGLQALSMAKRQPLLPRMTRIATLQASRAARMVIGYLHDRNILAPDIEAASGFTLTARGLQLAGAAMRRDGTMAWAEGRKAA